MAEQTVYLGSLASVDLAPTKVFVTATQLDAGSVRLDVTATAPSPWTFLEVGDSARGTLSRNAFLVLPGETQSTVFTGTASIPVLMNALAVRSVAPVV